MKKIENLFNNDYTKIHDLSFKYFGIFFFLLILVVLSLLLIKKDVIYKNEITFIDKNKAILIINDKVFNLLKENKKIELNNNTYECSINKIEEKEKMYLVYITFNVELVNIKTNNYQIKLGKESIVKYILRIMKGE